MEKQDSRFPARVYRHGSEPDARFSLANERTFLAWLRTSLALIAGGVALETLGLGINPSHRLAASLILIVCGGGDGVGLGALVCSGFFVPTLRLGALTAGNFLGPNVWVRFVLPLTFRCTLWGLNRVFVAFSAPKRKVVGITSMKCT
ncbi:YidH family protein [Dermabacteraceae bacterium P13101]